LKYISTRGSAPALDFDDALLAGLARDGGLYLPEAWPVLSPVMLAGLAGRPYAEIAARVVAPFMAGSVLLDELDEIAAETYAGFSHTATAPLKQLGPNLWMMELFHGPTLAFKDFALQFVGRLFDRLLRKRGQRITIIGATSGDTGAAAIEACRGLASVSIFILHPRGRVSPVQRRQMTTVDAPNVHNIAIKGTFDDCQDLVKALFADEAMRDEYGFGAVNSINWARVMAQIAYYVHAALALGGPARPVAFAVPTGNFGNVYAGLGARRMGLPIPRLIVGSNRNDILTRYFREGRMEMAGVTPTLSPSMDIQVSSNFERFLFDLYGGDGAALAEAMAAFRRDGRLDPGVDRWKAATAIFEGHRFGDEETVAAIGRLYRETGELIDPHSAIGIEAARAASLDPSIPVVALATAHPAKFPDAVERATGQRPALPEAMADLDAREERCATLANNLPALKGFLRERATAQGAA
jgi:threonine synthase